MRRCSIKQDTPARPSQWLTILLILIRSDKGVVTWNFLFWILVMCQNFCKILMCTVFTFNSYKNLLTYSIIQQKCINHLFCTKHCSRSWRSGGAGEAESLLSRDLWVCAHMCVCTRKRVCVLYVCVLGEGRQNIHSQQRFPIWFNYSIFTRQTFKGLYQFLKHTMQ